MRGVIRIVTVAILFALSLLLLPVSASEGDQSMAYYSALMSCRQSCTRATRLESHIAAVENGSETPAAGLTLVELKEQLAGLQAWRTWDLAFFRWTCEENCQYTTMHADVLARASRGLPTVKYYGKWPFTRVLGMQELFSTLFSVANAVPFAQALLTWRAQAPDSYFMKPLWVGYAVSAMNTWVWSTAFHARDTVLTERLDYFCATISICVMLLIALVRVFELRDRRAWAALGTAGALFLCYHCGYLHFVHFDYGYNMTVSVALGLAYVALWWAWALRQRGGRVTYAWKVALANLIILVFAAFEVFDFPPLWGLLDAHAVWHAATPVSTYLLWSFALDDAKFMADRSVYKLL